VGFYGFFFYPIETFEITTSSNRPYYAATHLEYNKEIGLNTNKSKINQTKKVAITSLNKLSIS